MAVNSDDELKHHYNAVEFISERYNRNIYYTWADLVLISLNPFKNSDFDADRNEILRKCLKESPASNFEPHIYSVAKRACNYIHINEKDQVIMITGDSGSGKTFAIQQALLFLSDEDTPLGKIKYSLVLLNAFGNAATEYHDNSSRFGKLILLGYDGYSNKILDASFQTYFLEKTRVSSPAVRNFHIFYQVIAACISGNDYDLHLKDCNCFKILPGTSTANDMKSFVNTLKAFDQLQFENSTVYGIFTVVAAILHLGNVTFTIGDDNNCCVDVEKEESCIALHYASNLLGLEPEAIKVLLTRIVIVPANKRARRSVYQIPVPTEADAQTRRDAVIKTLYLLLFDWIVARINLNFGNCDSESRYKLGLLDIYGFEIFSRNSLEQLCINYANERLHSVFVQDFLLQKRLILMKEGIRFDYSPKPEKYFKDSSARISILDAPFSVFGVINEGSLLSRHSYGRELCQRLLKLPRNKYITTYCKEQIFVITHFAGPVKYDASYMVEKNTDKVPNEIFKTLMASKNSFLVNFISKEDATFINKGTVLSKFKTSFDLLLNKLKTSQVHYVRCIKPNILMKPCFIDKEFLEKQLYSSGLLEAVKLCGHCSPIQFTFNEFLVHFHRLIGNYTMEPHGMCVENFQRSVILKWIKDLGLLCQVKDKNVFLSEREFALLEQKRQFMRQYCARVIQRLWRLHWNSKKYKAAKTIQKYFKKRIVTKRSCNISSSPDVNSVPLLRKPHFSENLVSTSNSSETNKFVQINRGGISDEANVEEDLMGCSVSQNIICTRSNKYDRPRVASTTTINRIRKVKLDLLLRWLDKIPVLSMSNINHLRSYPKSYSLCCYPRIVRSIQSGISSKSETISSLASSLFVIQEVPQIIRKDHSLQSALYSSGNKCYPGTSKLYSHHFLKKIIITEEAKGNEIYFIGNGVVSRRSLAKIPIWFHVRKTCLSYSYVLPYSEKPKGLEDILD